jgi:hypothetical protein
METVVSRTDIIINKDCFNLCVYGPNPTPHG